MTATALPRLVVLRGPSGSGKSTVARQLFERATSRVCLIQQDHYRFIFRPAGGGSVPNAATIHRMIEHNVTAALTDGFDVILEGILSQRSYGEVLDRIFGAGRSVNFLYSFDITIEESLRRHRTRAVGDPGFTEDDMRDWYPHAHPWGHHIERLIPNPRPSTRPSARSSRTPDHRPDRDGRPPDRRDDDLRPLRVRRVILSAVADVAATAGGVTSARCSPSRIQSGSTAGEGE